MGPIRTAGSLRALAHTPMFGTMIGDDLASPGFLDTFEFMGEPSSARSAQPLTGEMLLRREGSASLLGNVFLEHRPMDRSSGLLETIAKSDDASGAGAAGGLALLGSRKRSRAADEIGRSSSGELDYGGGDSFDIPAGSPRARRAAVVASLKRDVAELLSGRTLVGLGCFAAPQAGPQAVDAHARRQAARALLHYRCAGVVLPQWWKVRGKAPLQPLRARGWSRGSSATGSAPHTLLSLTLPFCFVVAFSLSFLLVLSLAFWLFFFWTFVCVLGGILGHFGRCICAQRACFAGRTPTPRSGARRDTFKQRQWGGKKSAAARRGRHGALRHITDYIFSPHPSPACFHDCA